MSSSSNRFLPLLLACLAGQGALAAEWSYEPRIEARALFDNNFLLRTSGAQSESAVVILPSISMARRTEISHASIDARAELWRFPGNSNLDTNDAYLDFSTGKRGERSQWQIDAGYVRNTSITSELADSGRVDIRRRRVSSNLAPSWSYLPSERARLSLNLRYDNVDFEDAATEFYDYTYLVGSASWLYQLDQRNQIQVLLSHSRYEVNSLGLVSKTNGLQAGLVHNFTPLLTGTALIGLRRTDNNGVSDNGALALISVEHKGRRLKLGASLSRDVMPSSLGQLNQSDRIRLDAAWRFNELRWIQVVLLAGRNLNTGIGTRANDRNFVDLAINGYHYVGRHWRMIASYRYRQHEYLVSGASARSSRISLGVQYRFGKRAVSR